MNTSPSTEDKTGSHLNAWVIIGIVGSLTVVVLFGVYMIVTGFLNFVTYKCDSASNVDMQQLLNIFIALCATFLGGLCIVFFYSILRMLVKDIAAMIKYSKNDKAE